MALAASEVTVELREVKLQSKPAELLEVSPKGTVPVLVLPEGLVIDESLDIMTWAIGQHDPLFNNTAPEEASEWIRGCDDDFKHWLDRYKYSDRYPGNSSEMYRSKAEGFLKQMESVLTTRRWLGGTAPTLIDVAVFPFIRQFAGVDQSWWEKAPYPALRVWLADWLDTSLFLSVMKKYRPWEMGCPGELFPNMPPVRETERIKAAWLHL